MGRLATGSKSPPTATGSCIQGPWVASVHLRGGSPPVSPHLNRLLHISHWKVCPILPSSHPSLFLWAIKSVYKNWLPLPISWKVARSYNPNQPDLLGLATSLVIIKMPQKTTYETSAKKSLIALLSLKKKPEIRWNSNGLNCSVCSGAVHKWRWQFFQIFDTPLPHVGSFLVLSIGNFDQFLTPPPYQLATLFMDGPLK